MRFTVPQFIEHEPKIVGPLTFKQFMFIGGAAVACFVVYFSAPFTVFIISCFVFEGIAFAFAFLKINGIPLSAMLINFLKFNLSPRMYLWKKGEGPIGTVVGGKLTKEEIPEDELPLKIGGASRLKNIKTKIETKQ